MLESLRELKTIAPRLNESSDSLNPILSQINEQLNQMNLGLTVWLDAPPLINKGIEPTYFQKKHRIYSVEEREILGYTKLKSGWGLAVKSVVLENGYFEGDENCPFTNPIDGDVRPLLECSRDIRTNSIELLPRLFDLLKDKAEKVINSLESAKALSSQI